MPSSILARASGRTQSQGRPSPQPARVRAGGVASAVRLTIEQLKPRHQVISPTRGETHFQPVLLGTVIRSACDIRLARQRWLVTAISVITLREFYARVSRMGLDPFDRVGQGSARQFMIAPYYFARLRLVTGER